MPRCRASQSASRRLDQWVAPAASEAGAASPSPPTPPPEPPASSPEPAHPAGPRPPAGDTRARVPPPLGGYRRLAAPDPPRDRRTGQPLLGQQHDPRPLRNPGRLGLRPGPALQFRPVAVSHPVGSKNTIAPEPRLDLLVCDNAAPCSGLSSISPSPDPRAVPFR